MAVDLNRLRKVLDFVPASETAGWPDREYYDALARRLNREVVADGPVTRVVARRAKDEAILVVPPEEWDAAQKAREHQLEQAAELARVRGELEAVQSREGELQEEVDELRGRLSGLKEEREEKRKVALQLVGIKRPAPPAPPSDQLAAEGWEVLPEEGETAPPAEPAPVDALGQAGWQVEAPGGGASSDRAAAVADETDAAIARVEAEIHKIEQELEDLAIQERGIQERGGPAPYTHGDYALYRRSVGKGAGARDLYFFSESIPTNGEATPLPAGYVVKINPSSGLPLLKKAAKATKKARAKRRKK